MNSREIIINYINENNGALSDIAKQIWNHPEVALQEEFASNLLAKTLEDDGFSIERDLGQIPNSFIATWGDGQPIIGFLGEFDALPGLSQKQSAEKDPMEEGGPGHGCGHNLFGTACMGSVMALKRVMSRDNIKGTIWFYGCPAEETLIGKIFMAREGVFNDLDAAIAWHPGNSNIVWNSSSLAMNSFKVNFHGISSHASAMPQMGRSALDGVILMDVGINYLREHIAQEARVHSVITKGGEAPNVVPAYSQVWYFIRAPQRDLVDEIYKRMLDIAKGAALMTGTTYDVEFITGCYELLQNKTLSTLLLEKMHEAGEIKYTDEELDFAKKIQQTFPEHTIERSFIHMRKSVTAGISDDDVNNPLWGQVLTHSESPQPMGGSTDVGDVSWITPTGQIMAACWPIGTPAHSWQAVASSGSSIGFKGMLFSAKSMALAGLDLLVKPELLKQAQEEHVAARKGKDYISPLPDGVVPR